MCVRVCYTYKLGSVLATLLRPPRWQLHRCHPWSTPSTSGAWPPATSIGFEDVSCCERR